MNVQLFPQIRSVDTMGTLPMSIIAWHDSGLNYASFPRASGYLSFFVRHAFFGFLRIFEQFLTGSYSGFVSVNFIHQALGFSGSRRKLRLQVCKLMESLLPLHVRQEVSQF